MYSVKETYRGGVSGVLRIGYGHTGLLLDYKSNQDKWGDGIFWLKTLQIRVNEVLLHPNEAVGPGPMILSPGF
jgi:hypothetical protein